MFFLKLSFLIFFVTLLIPYCATQGVRNMMGQMGRGMGNGMGQGGRGMGMGGGRVGMGRAGGLGQTNQATGIANKGLPPGYANIRGEVMDMTNKLIQRVTSVGTNYFAYDNQNGAPVFKRREADSARRFVLFPDMNFPQGDGHYIVLRKMPGVNIPGLIPQALYEAFQLSLGDSIHGYVSEFNNNDYLNGNIGVGGKSGRTGGGYGGIQISSGRGTGASGFGIGR